jgi:hypothetical protein
MRSPGHPRVQLRIRGWRGRQPRILTSSRGRCPTGPLKIFFPVSVVGVLTDHNGHAKLIHVSMSQQKKPLRSFLTFFHHIVDAKFI